MSYYSKFLSLSRGKQIALAVFASHFLSVFFLCAHHFFSKEKPKSKMVVRTSFANPSSMPVSAPNPLSMKAGSSQVAALPSKRTPDVKKKGEGKEKKEKDSSGRNAKATRASSIDLTLLQKIEKELVLIEQEKSSFTGSFSPSLPKNVAEAAKEEEAGLSQSDYGEVLASFLQSSLELPELGEVVVDLIVDSSGRLVHFTILEAKSRKNGEFLKKRLPELILPCFNGVEKSYATRNFTITFKNATGL